MKRILACVLVLIITIVAGITSYASKIIGATKDDNYSIEEDLIGQISDKMPNYTTIDKIPENLINAVISTEDKRFFKHNGFDILALGRAFATNIKEGKIKQGASTITQQLAKNLFLSNERTYKRKIKEFILAVELEKRYPKDKILEMYLNVIYYGNGAFGIADASKTYFGKKVSELSLAECAMLAGLPQAPTMYNPKKYYDRAKKRQQIVLALMAKNHYIDKKVQNNTIKQQVLVTQ